MLTTEDADENSVRKYNSYSKNKKRTVLSRLITAVGNFSVQYNFQAISIALLVMAASVCTADDDACRDGEQSSWVSSTATATVFVGAITGQLTMGYAGDVLGRTHAMTLTLGLVTFAAMLSAAAPQGSPTSIYSTIIVMRFILGIGVGGVYPLSATKAAEDGGKGGDSIDLTAASMAFFWQVPGSMTPWILAYIFSFCDMSADTKWRLLLGLGAVPACFVVICSILEARSMESQEKADDMSASHALLNQGYADQFSHHTDGAIVSSKGSGRGGATQAPFHASSGAGLLVERKVEDHEDSSADREKYSVSRYLKERSTWIDLLVTGGGWFIYDVAYYGVNLFGGQILSAISSTDDDNVSADSSIRMIAEKQIIALGMGLPACVLAIFTLRAVGIKRLQVYGFVIIAACFVLLACLFAPLSHGRLQNTNALFAVYCMLLFSLSYGPNLTTYLLPAQTYPKEVRATFNGISAACGKLGAFTGVYVFGPMAESTSYATVMVFCAGLSLFGAVVSQLGIREPVQKKKKSSPFDLDDAIDDVESDSDSIVQ